jgi:hypothetical protein
MNSEYRVIWKREGLPKKYKQCARYSTAKRFIDLLTSIAPWELFDQNPDDVHCCNGYQCHCKGETIREHYQNKINNMPALESVELKVRDVSPWREPFKPINTIEESE